MNTKDHGFTLIELMITIAIAAILVTVAVPNFRTIIQNNRITAQANDFLTALSIARSEALKRGRNVTISANTPNQWGNGWTITDNAGSALYTNDGFDAASTLTSSDSINSITFNSRGFLTRGQPLNFTLSTSGATTGRAINIAPSGGTNIHETTVIN